MTFEANRLIPVKIVTQTSASELLLALNGWLEKSLITDTQITFKVAAEENLAPDAINLEINGTATISEFLEGLSLWEDRNLLTVAQILCKVEVKASHPYLLEGLEEWLELGFLSESKVKQLCEENLSCVLPPVNSFVAVTPTPESQPTILPQSTPTTPRKTQSPGRLRQILQSLMAELSVFWLLLLGVFMIVVSSGVIAANLWEKFSATGQYGVLWLYTMAFWGANFWASKQPNLRLTSMALRVVTLLLVPMNFLAMDSLGLWHNPLDWFIVVLAAMSLTTITVQLFRKTYGKTPPDQFSRSLPTHLGLSYLHWGWGIAGFSLWATYLGIVGTALMTFSRPLKINRQKRERLARFGLNEVVVASSLVILMVRAIFIAQVNITQLGLAVGICGWIASRETRSPVSVWHRIGAGLLLMGWLLSVAEVPWQALGVTGLGILFFKQRLLRSWLKRDLAILLLIGLQGLWLVWRLIPAAIAQGAIYWGMRLTGTEDAPRALLSLALFPYLILILMLANWFSKLGKGKLANFSDTIALSFGTILTVLSLVNPALRTLNFAASTLVLGTLSQREVKKANQHFSESESEYFPSIPLANFTHIAGLITLGLGIEWALPKLSLGIWAIILLILMFLELILSARQETYPFSLLQIIGQSSWYLGLILGGLSYGLLLLNQTLVFKNWTFMFDRPLIGLEWALVWGLTPLALTGIGTFNLPRRQLASWLSVVALILWQRLTLAPSLFHWLEIGIAGNFIVPLVGLDIAVVLMLVNTRNLQHIVAAGITVGFSLSLITLCLGGGSFGWTVRQEASWLMVGAIAIIGLWMLRQWLNQNNSETMSTQETNLSILYARACDAWAIAICCLELGILVGHTGRMENPFLTFLVLILLMGATACRSWQSPRYRSSIWLSVIALLVAQLPLLGLTSYRSMGLVLATGIMTIHTRYLQKRNAAIINVGLALALVSTCLWDGWAGWALRSVEGWLLAVAVILITLWWLRNWFRFSLRFSELAALYAQAVDNWAIAICCLELVAITVHSLFVYWYWISASGLSILAPAITLGAIAYRSWRVPNNWSIYGIGWSLEILTIEVLDVTEASLIALAIANIVLGLITQLLGDWWHRHSGRPEMLTSWNILPLLYGALGVALRWGVFTSWTGLSSLGLVLIAIGIGRRSRALKPLVYLGIAGISISAYELLLFQIGHLPTGDKLLAMAALAGSFVYGYQLLSSSLVGYLRLPRVKLKWIEHLHWALGSFLLLGAPFYPVEFNQLLGLGTGLFFTQYAIFQGRNYLHQTIAEIWVYLGILQAATIAVYIGSMIPDNEFLTRYFAPWFGTILSVVAVTGYLLPWSRWGWPPRPWQMTALILPLIGIGGYMDKVNEVSLLVVAGFYVWLARTRRQLRWYYLTLVMVNWAIVRWLEALHIAIPFAYCSLVGVSLICVSWIEPACRETEGKSLRHYLRLLGTGIICGAALWLHHQTGILPAIVSFMAILLGLALRVRAFLYIGTLTFFGDVFYQLVILIFDYPLLKWIVGLLVGLSLLYIAGSFETRRIQITALFQNWLSQLQEWE